MRELINAMFFMLRGGCPWRMLPEHFPPHQTAYRWFTAARGAMMQARKSTGASVTPWSIPTAEG